MRKIIGILYRTLLKPILFCFPPEAMHTFFGRVGYLLGKLWITRKMTQAIFSYAHPSLMQTCRGMTFANPVWLAAGFDKDIQLPQIIDAVGFGRTEVWSITYQPYAGNTWKRLIRLLTSQGLLVNYGLKNNGAVWAKQRLLHTSCRVPLFVSIAKTNCVATCDLQKGIADYQGTGELLWTLDQVNGFVLNIFLSQCVWRWGLHNPRTSHLVVACYAIWTDWKKAYFGETPCW
jgi:dihydroorotate dehydrogenase